MRKQFTLIVVGLIIAVSVTLAGVDASLKDDVFTMIKQTRKIVHTMLLMDTSEQMNNFAYSDYLNTCADTKHKLNSSHAMCMASYHQCRDAENNAACSVDLGCDDILGDCTDLLAAKTDVTAFCDDVALTYPEPSLTDKVANPLTDSASKKYVGPWNPREDYKLDLCFYNWTDDTGGDVVAGTNSRHPSNDGIPNNYDPDGDGTWNDPNDTQAPPADRRDWDCMTDGNGGAVTRGGLWLNWKYTTSLGSMKIVIADTHAFGYPPKMRGKAKCVETEYLPKNKTDASTGQTTCYSAEFATAGDEDLYADMDVDVLPMSVKEKAEEIIKDEWVTTKTDVNLIPPDATVCANLGEFAPEAGVPPAPPIDAVSMGCDVCKGPKGYTIPCENFGEVASSTGNELESITLSTNVNMYCCATFRCATPACRDDDTCDHGGTFPACSLGDYSIYDQDQSHCCDDLTCEEIRPAGDCAKSGSKFIPGPTGQRTVSDSVEFTMDALNAGESYSSVTLTADVTLALTGNHSTENTAVTPPVPAAVTIRIFSGCIGTDPATEIISKNYDADVSGDTITTTFDLSGCDDVGYAVKAMLTLNHDGDPSNLDGTTSPSEATANATVDFSLDYARSATGSIDVLDINSVAFSGHGIEADPSTVIVNEYECRTTTYALQSYVQSGGSGGCDYSKMHKPDGSPFEYCAYPSHKTIDKDQWGNVKKTLCTWLCSQDPEYTDAWACQEFFEQMDVDTRNGPGEAAITCESTQTLEQCCASVHTHFATHSPAYRIFTPCQTVAFAGGSYKCCMAGFQQGVNDGEYFFTGGNQTEVLVGHIQEAGGGSYRLSDAAYISPYAGDPWYTTLSLISKPDSFLSQGYVSLFRTATTASERATACVYDIVQDAYGEDCDPCSGGGGCCTVEASSSIDYCDYPTFWVKIPKSEGGHLVRPAAHLTGGAKLNFQSAIRSFKGVGGSTLAETLYDMWRYVGGMVPYQDDFSQMGTPFAGRYESPIQADPDCFINETFILSGGQPQFDSNISIKTAAGAGAPDINHKPYVEIDPGDPENIIGEPPQYIHNYYISALAPSAMPASFPDGATIDNDGGVAKFVHTVDAYNSDATCQGGAITTNAYGFTPACRAADSTSATNFINHISTVGIGSWALGPLYAINNSGFLDNDLLKQAATDGDGNFYGLTAGAPTTSGNAQTFNNITDLVNAMDTVDPPETLVGLPHISATFIQPFINQNKTMGPESYIPTSLPVDNSESRFWFGNLRKYDFHGNPSSPCYVNEGETTGFTEYKISQMEGDCFTPTYNNASIDATFSKTFNKGAYIKLEQQLQVCTGNGTSTGPCFLGNTSRNIYYDRPGVAGLQRVSNLTAVHPDYTWLGTQMGLGTVATETSQVLDYLYGYDVFDDNGDSDLTGKRDWLFTAVDPTSDPASPSYIGLKMSILGAPIHSIPIAVHYGSTHSTRIYFGAADGMMHSFTQDGNEAWAYIPSPVLPKMSFITDNTPGLLFHSTVDGPIAFLHFDNPAAENGIVNTGEKAYIIFGYRRGAHAYTVVDVSDPDVPVFVQHITTDAESWGKPLLFKRGGIQYMAITGGYDPCFDPDVPTCASPIGNRIDIYRWDMGQNKFVAAQTYNAASAGAHIQNADWLRLPFAADGMKLQISAETSAESDFLYFVDITSSVFRIDLRTSPWKFRLALKNRASSTVSNATWLGGFRSYHSFSQFPPQQKYPTGSNDGGTTQVMPIPVATGDLVNPGRTGEPNKVFVFYDPIDADFSVANSYIEFSTLDHVSSLTTHDGDTFKNGETGWFWLLDDSPSRKVISRPLLFYDKDTTEMWYIMWSAFAPANFGECTSAGNAYFYARMLMNGSSVPDDGMFTEIFGESALHMGEGKPTDISTTGAPETGPMPTPGTGDSAFALDSDFTLDISAPASYLKWYELY